MAKQINSKQEFEKKIVSEMIDMYGKGHPEYQNSAYLKKYASMRIDQCPFMETKTFCSACKIHCYNSKEQEEIKKVMRWSGPRMLFHHPFMAIHHMMIEHRGALKRGGWLVLGFIGLGLGFLGAILPLLPAFPFLLLAAVAFSKSSTRLHTWFIKTKLYQKNIKTWHESRSMEIKVKIRVLLCISLVMAIGFIMMKKVPWAQFILFLVWIGHILYFKFGIKTMPTQSSK